MPSSLLAEPPPNGIREQPNQEALRQFIDFLRVRENPFEVLVAPRKADLDAAQNYVHEACPGVWRQLQAIIQRQRPPKLEYESDLPRTGVATIIGARGSGKTATLHALQLTFADSHRHIIVAPSIYEPTRPFVEFLYLDLIRHLKEEVAESGGRTIDLLAEAFTRQILVEALRGVSKVRWIARSISSKFDFFASLRGWQTRDIVARKADIIRELEPPELKCIAEVIKRNGVPVQLLTEIAFDHIDKTMPETTLAACVRKGLYKQFVKCSLDGDSQPIFDYLYDGFTRIAVQGDHPKESCVNEIFQTLVELCLLTQVPILFAFDSLEFLLLEPPDPVRCSAFFTGLASVIDSVRGLAFLIFAETGHWQSILKFRGLFAEQRMNQGIVGVPEFGTVTQIVLPNITPATLKSIIHARLMPLTKIFFNGSAQSISPFNSAELDAACRSNSGGQSSFRDGLARIRDLYSEKVQKRQVVNTSLNGTGVGHGEQMQAIWTELLIAGKIASTNLAGSSLASLHQGLMLWLRAFQQEGQFGIVDVLNDTSGDHPVFGQVTVIEREEDGKTEKAAVGFFVGTGSSMPADLGSKLRLMETAHAEKRIDRIVILWPKLISKDPVSQLPNRTRETWNEIVKGDLAGKIALRCVDPAVLAVWLTLPKWRTQVTAENPGIEAAILDHFVVEQSKDLLKWLRPA